MKVLNYKKKLDKEFLVDFENFIKGSIERIKNRIMDVNFVITISVYSIAL